MSDYPVDVVRSKRRKRTVSASLRQGRIKVMVPDSLEPGEEARLVDEMARRVRRKATAAGVNLNERVAELSAQYGLSMPAEIEWSERQKRTWGSCSADGRIRVSSRLASMPVWVLDWVLIHEMAHLEVPDHGPRFDELVRRYELGERAKGYLIAVSERAPNID